MYLLRVLSKPSVYIQHISTAYTVIYACMNIRYVVNIYISVLHVIVLLDSMLFTFPIIHFDRIAIEFVS